MTISVIGLIAALAVMFVVGFVGGVAFWELTSKEPSHEHCNKH